MRSLLKALVVFGVIGLLAGCSSDSNNNVTPDVKVIPDLGGPGDDTTALNYPSGPYGTQKGDVIANMEFYGFRDPQTFCTMEKNLDVAKKVKAPLSFAYYHDHACDGTSSLTKPKKLLWVMVSAGWCGPCIAELKELAKEIEAGAIDERVTFTDILFENDDYKPVTEAFAKTWQETLKIKFPLLMDPDFKMGKYFDRKAVPFNMLVDLDTMQVYFSTTGAAFTLIGQQIQSFFAGQ